MRLKIGGGAVLDVTPEVAEDLRRQLSVHSPGCELVDAAAAAKQLGVSRVFVYEHARELGGQKVGCGPKAPWRFDPAGLTGTAPTTKVEHPPEPKPTKHTRRGETSAGVKLLEIRGTSPYAA
jgi:hypothetical protein